ncbi:MAG: sugar transferase [Paracoccus sp. (in: a-proteobacteria)]|nr:sugar transferase [Paracoccus sp. (in: a-proteobacteria)]
MKDNANLERENAGAQSTGETAPTARRYIIDAVELDAASLSRAVGESRVSAKVAKRSFDVAGTLVLLIVFAPLLILIATVLKLRYGGPVLYGHRRVGRDNREFLCLKFRTMQPDADRLLAECLRDDPGMMAEWAATQKLRNDPRVHPIGRLLRHSSMDELPQFFNVLSGSMSLVGPRPITRDEMRYYGPDLRAYASVRPGITGLWQVSGRNDTSYDERVALDVRYAAKWSFAGDLRILMRTVKVVLTGRGAY